MNAHDHHAGPAHTDAHTSATTDPGAGKQPRVEAAKAPTKEHYQKQVREFMSDVFFIKNSAIATSQMPLSASPVKPSPSLLGQALTFAIGAASGPFMDAVGLVGLARVAASSVFPEFAKLVGGTIQSKPKNLKIELDNFITDYQFAVREHHDQVTQAIEKKITNTKNGKEVVESLHGAANAGKLSVTGDQEQRIRDQTKLEALDAWTVALQKEADKEDKGKQGFSDSSTGQLHLHSLAVYANGKFKADVPTLARMDGVGNQAAQWNANRKLQSIPVQRTINVLLMDSQSNHIGISVSADGKTIRKDEFSEQDRATLYSFYKSRHRNAAPGNDDVAVAEIWNAIKGSSPKELGFAMKGD